MLLNIYENEMMHSLLIFAAEANENKNGYITLIIKPNKRLLNIIAKTGFTNQRYAAVKYELWDVFWSTKCFALILCKCFCINMHRPIIDTLKENLDQGFKTRGVMIEKTETQSTPNLHYALNLEHKSLQDVYRATQSEPIRASYRPVEFALFKKHEEGH